MYDGSAGLHQVWILHHSIIRSKRPRVFDVVVNESLMIITNYCISQVKEAFIEYAMLMKKYSMVDIKGKLKVRQLLYRTN